MKSAIGIVIILLCGCSFVPFEKTDYVSMGDINPNDVLLQFREDAPKEYKLINTAIFQFRTRKFISLGYLSVDMNEKAFELAGMNSMGIKLVEIAAKNRKVLISNVVDEIQKRGDVTKVLVEDIYRIYFDLTPEQITQVDKRKKSLVFSQQQREGTTRYTFAGKNNYLREKVYYKGKKKVWSVRYYEYMQKDGKVYPKGIIYKNYLHKYKLIINVKEII